MTLELYKEVALTRDLPEYQLRAGDIATLVDFVSHPSGGEAGCVLEVFNAVGESLAVISVPISAVKVLRADEILTVRFAKEDIINQSDSSFVTGVDKRSIKYGSSDKIMGDKIDTQINNSQDLAQATKDIKALLDRLSADYPSDSLRVLGAKAVDRVEKSRELKSRLLRGVKAGGFAALEKTIDRPVAKFFIEGIKEVLKP